MRDIKQDVKESVKVFTLTFVSYVVKESTKKLIKSLTQTKRKMLEYRVKNLSDDQLEEYFDKDPYFKSELENTVKSINQIHPTHGSRTWLENLQTVCEDSCIQNLIKVLIQQATRMALAVLAGTALLAVIAIPAVIDNNPDNVSNFLDNINIKENLGYITREEQPTPAEEPVLSFANFSSNVTSGCAPLSVQFSDLSGNTTEWKWDFGDGSNSTEQNPVHTYFFAGNYTVKLTVANGEVTNREIANSKLATITALEQPLLPIANFSSNTERYYVPFPVQFIDLSENATEWNWDFGDGTNSTEQNPVHTYFFAGNYTINLTAINSNGTDSKLAIIKVLKRPEPVQEPALPVANFSTNVTRGYYPLSVQFTDQSENATERNWDFGDGTSSTEKSPVHTYSAAGNYAVRLTVNNEDGTDSTFAIIEVLPSRITTSGSAYHPAIYGDRIVWDDYRNGNRDIYMYDLSTFTETRITTNESYQRYPAIYGDRIVWEDDPNENFDIYMYDLSTFTETQITTTGSATDPAIYGDRIVREDWRNDNSDIYMYDLSTFTETQITTTGSATDPAIYGDRIVWEDWRNDYSDIYMYDLSTFTETRITTNESSQKRPAIYGDRIVWDDYRNGNRDIYMYDLSTSTETRITTNESYQWYPAIYGDRIVWEDDRNGNSDIYMYDLSTSTETRITTNELWHYSPAIYGDRIVWEMLEESEAADDAVDEESGEVDIYMYDLSVHQ